MQTFTNIKIIDRTDVFETIQEGSKKGHSYISKITISTRHGLFHIDRDHASSDGMARASAELGKGHLRKMITVNGDKIIDWK